MWNWLRNLFKRKPVTTFDRAVPKEVAKVYNEFLRARGTSRDFGNPRYIAEVNLGLNSKYNRFFIYDRVTKKLHKFKTSHGSGRSNRSPNNGECREVGNISGSHMSCLGLFECAETYHGRLGYCMRIDGLSSTNSKARPRAILVHKARYVRQDSNGIQGMSWGCFAIDVRHNKWVIDVLKNGSPLFAHHNGKTKI